jgi:hypothetical protein
MNRVMFVFISTLSIAIVLAVISKLSGLDYAVLLASTALAHSLAVGIK